MRSFYFYACFALLSACNSNQKEQPANPANKTEGPTSERTVSLTPEQIKNGGIRIGAPEKRDLNRTLKVNGYIDVPPDHIVSVTFPLGGYIEKINLLPGMPIRKGQALVTLTDPQYIQLQQEFLTGKTRLQYLEADFNRQKALQEGQATSEKIFQQAESEFRSQQVTVKALEEKLKLIGIDPYQLTTENLSGKIILAAPISGSISKVNVNAGQYVTPTDILFELIDPSEYHLNVSVLENDLPTLSLGQTVTCHPNNNPNKSYAAKIMLINRQVGSDRSAEVHCHFDRGSADLMPGMFMNAEIAITNKQVLTVPNDAIVRWQNKQYIFSTEDNLQFEMHEVETGIADNAYTEIMMGSAPEKIVVKNAYTILMKLKNSSEE